MLAKLGSIPTTPSVHGPGPLRRHLRQQIDPGAHILSTLGVVSRSRVHRAGPVHSPLDVEVVKSLESHGFGAAANVVHRDQAIINVERRIFDAFGHDRSRDLLPAHHEPQSVFVVLQIEKQYRPDKIEGSAADLGIALSSVLDGVLDTDAVPRPNPEVAVIGAIY